MIGTKRIAELGDGVFAIAMTLLAFDLRISDIITPAASHNAAQIISDIWPHLIIFAMSFVLLGFYWIEHRVQFRYIKYYDKYFLWINIFFYMFIALIPFSTGILGRYLGEQFSVILYGINIILLGILSYFHWWYVNTYHLMGKDTTPALISTIKRRILLVPIIAIMSILISFFNLWVGLSMYALIPLYYIFLSGDDILKSKR